jgi:hypothetical protein
VPICAASQSLIELKAGEWKLEALQYGVKRELGEELNDTQLGGGKQEVPLSVEDMGAPVRVEKLILELALESAASEAEALAS